MTRVSDVSMGTEKAGETVTCHQCLQAVPHVPCPVRHASSLPQQNQSHGANLPPPPPNTHPKPINSPAPLLLTDVLYEPRVVGDGHGRVDAGKQGLAVKLDNKQLLLLCGGGVTCCVTQHVVGHNKVGSAKQCAHHVQVVGVTGAAAAAVHSGTTTSSYCNGCWAYCLLECVLSSNNGHAPNHVSALLILPAAVSASSASSAFNSQIYCTTTQSLPLHHFLTPPTPSPFCACAQLSLARVRCCCLTRHPRHHRCCHCCCCLLHHLLRHQQHCCSPHQACCLGPTCLHTHTQR